MTDGVDWERVQTIFGEALDRPPAERAVFVAEQCGDDTDMLAEVESLLRHHEQSAEDFMRPPLPPEIDVAAGPPDVAAGPGAGRTDPLVGRDVGGFHIERAIASGGMGTVYLAEQQQPHRPVALKLLRAGIASESALRRFEYESEILAHLRHPNIAEVYEAGTYVGLPYFVMEYIADARTITDYAAAARGGRQPGRWGGPPCPSMQPDGGHGGPPHRCANSTDAHPAAGLSHRDRLRLFEQVCEAVHYGHQRGVIHRDLKPGNILVDADGRVRVIDFGVARATDADITLTTLHTGAGELVGTLQYMSPEQCDGDPHEIDVRSDVYSLGLVLYELLCGRLPYEVGNLAVASAARMICERVPPRPSSVTGKKGSRKPSALSRKPSALSRKPAATTVPARDGQIRAPSVSKRAKTVPPSRGDYRGVDSGGTGVSPVEVDQGGTGFQPVRGDLERIILKSLEKDRRQRYQSAADLLRDIRHYLNREPIEAKPPTLWTRTLRWVARHPALATTTTCLTIAALVFAATGVSVWWYDREPHEIVRCDAAGEVATPQRVALGMRAVEARLIARSGSEFCDWRTKTGHIPVAELVERPPEFGGGMLAIIGFADAAECEWGHSLAAFDVPDNTDDPDWIGKLAEDDLPVAVNGRAFDCSEFNINSAYLVEDFFPDQQHPGLEIAVVHGHNDNSLRVLRIYDLRGQLLYQVWQDGGIVAMYWMADARLLVCYGQNGERRWDEWGWTEIGSRNPHVVFAIRPEPGQVLRGYLETQPGDGALYPAWYYWLSPPRLFGDTRRSVTVSLTPPRRSEWGMGVRIAFNFYDENDVYTRYRGNVVWEFDAQGQQIPDTRRANDDYKTNLSRYPTDHPERLPDPNEIRTEPWPPTPPATPRAASP